MQRKRTRLVRVGAVLAAASLVAAACGDDDDDEEPPPVETPAPEEDDEPVETPAETPPDDEEPPETTAPDEEAPDETPPPDDAEIEGEAIDDPDVLNIAYVLPQTGDLGSISEALIQPLFMAVEEVNEVGDTEVNLFGADSGTNPAIAGPAVDAVLGQNPSAVMGPAASGVTGSVIERVMDEGVVQCSGSNTAAVLGDPAHEFYFRTAPSDDLQGPALADVVAEDGYIDVAVIYRNDDYGVGFAGAIMDRIEDAGGEVVADIAYDPNATTFDGEAAEIAAADPEAVVLISFVEGGQVMNAAIGQGIGPQDVQWYVADGFADSEAPEVAGAENVQGVRGTNPSSAPEELGEQTFPERFAEFAGEGVPTIFSAHFYDCLIVTVLASEIAGSTDPADIREEMTGVTRDGTDCSRYEECHQLILDGEDINYNGASGPLEFDEVGQPTIGTYDVFEYDDEGNNVAERQIIIGE